MIVYCPKCKKKVALVNAKEIEIKGKKEIKGKCPFCGTIIYTKKI